MPAVPTLSSIFATIGVAIVVIAVLVGLVSALTGRVERRQNAAAPVRRPAVPHRPNEEDAGHLTAEELAGLPVSATVPAQRTDRETAPTR